MKYTLKIKNLENVKVFVKILINESTSEIIEIEPFMTINKTLFIPDNFEPILIQAVDQNGTLITVNETFYFGFKNVENNTVINLYIGDKRKLLILKILFL